MVGLGKGEGLFPIGSQQAALRMDPVFQIQTAPEYQTGHVIFFVIHPIQQIYKGGLNTADPEGFGDKKNLLFHQVTNRKF